MTHVELYKQRIEQIYHTTFHKAFGKPHVNVRQTAYFVVYRFSGYRLAYIGKLFGVSITGIGEGVRRQMGYINSGETKLYNDMLQIYIECCKEVIKRMHRP